MSHSLTPGMLDPLGMGSSAATPGQPGALLRNPPIEDESRPRNLSHLLHRHALLIGVCMAAGGVAGAFATSRLPRLYESAVSIRVDRNSAQLSAIGVPSLSVDNAVSTELEMLNSRVLAQKVVDSLGLRLQVAGSPRARARAPRSRIVSDVTVATDAPPATYRLVASAGGQIDVLDAGDTSLARVTPAGPPVHLPGVTFRLASEAASAVPVDLAVFATDDAVDSVQSWVTASRRNREADLLDLRVRTTDSELAREVANTLARVYIASHQNARQLEAKRSVEFLRDQLARATNQLQNAERSLRDYRSRAGVVSLSDEASTGVNRRAELLAQRNSIEAEREALARLLQTAVVSGRNGGGPYRDLLAFPTLIRSTAASELQGALTATEQKRAELLTRRTERDAEAQSLESRINELHAQIRAFVSTYLQGLANQVDALDATLARSDAALATLPGREFRHAELERGAKSTESVVAMLQARFKEAEIAAAATDESIRLVDTAVLPRKPVSPKPLVNLALSILVGGMIGVGGAFTRESSDRSLRTRAQLLALTGSPVLSLIPRLQAVHGLTSHLPRLQGRRTAILFGDGASPAQRPQAVLRSGSSRARASYTSDDLFGFAESYSRLVTNLRFVGPEQKTQLLLVTSALPGDGKTTVATNLALTMAREGKRVLLIDADLRNGRVDGTLGLPVGPGLAEVLKNQVDVGYAIATVAVNGTSQLHVLARGADKVDPAPLLASDAPRALLGYLRSRYDSIVIDTPPVNSVADAALLTRYCDGVLFVARAGVTTHDALVFAVEQLRIVHAPVIGAVLNDVDLRGDAAIDGAYQYYGQYHASRSSA